MSSDSLTRHLWSRSSRVALALVVIVLVFLIGTPFVIRQVASQWLLDNGGDRVRVGDVDFNPFTGTLLFEDAQVLVGEQGLPSSQSPCRCDEMPAADKMRMAC